MVSASLTALVTLPPGEGHLPLTPAELVSLLLSGFTGLAPWPPSLPACPSWSGNWVLSCRSSLGALCLAGPPWSLLRGEAWPCRPRADAPLIGARFHASAHPLGFHALGLQVGLAHR